MEKKEKSDEVIRLTDIGKSYYIGKQEVPVLTKIDLTISKGEFVSIMGPSGAGKSTLMNILGCLDRPSRGSYKLDGEEVARLGDSALAYTRNRKIGFVFQSFNLLPKLSALDNVILPMIYGNVFKKERRERALRMLDSWGWVTVRIICRQKCRAGSASASPSPVRSSMTLPSSWRMSRQGIWTASRQRRSWRSFPLCIKRGRPSSSSRMRMMSRLTRTAT